MAFTPIQLAAVKELLEQEYEAFGPYEENRLVYATALAKVAEYADRVTKLLVEDVDATLDWASPDTLALLEAAGRGLEQVLKELLIAGTVERGGTVGVSDAGKLVLTPKIDGSITVPSRVPVPHPDFG